jgi:hypothetical protein
MPPKDKVGQDEVIRISDYGFPVFHCVRPVTPEDVGALEDEE